MANSEWQMASGKPHQRLELWQQAMLLVKEIYSVTTGFPKEEMFGLVSQMRRAAYPSPPTSLRVRPEKATRNILIS